MISKIKHKIDELMHHQAHAEEQAGALAHKLDGIRWAEGDGDEIVSGQVPHADDNDSLAEAAYRARPRNPLSDDF